MSHFLVNSTTNSIFTTRITESSVAAVGLFVLKIFLISDLVALFPDGVHADFVFFDVFDGDHDGDDAVGVEGMGERGRW